MIKFVYCVRKKADISHEAFKKYWLEMHGPRVKSFSKILRAKKYVQSHTIETPLNEIAREPRGAKEPYDGITEIWWDSEEELIEVVKTPEGQNANLKLGEDEANFVDLENSAVFFTREHTIF